MQHFSGCLGIAVMLGWTDKSSRHTCAKSPCFLHLRDSPAPPVICYELPSNSKIRQVWQQEIRERGNRFAVVETGSVRRSIVAKHGFQHLTMSMITSGNGIKVQGWTISSIPFDL